MPQVSPDSTILAIHVACWILWALAAVAVALRFVARLKRKHDISWDDHFMLLSLVLNLLAGILASYATSFGAGAHMQDVIQDPEDLSKALYWSNVANTAGLLGDAFPKIAVALLANRILVTSRWMRNINLAIPTLLLVIIVIIIIVLWVQCRPIAHQWDPINVPGTCWNPDILNGLDFLGGAWGTATDLYFVVYPSIVISRLQMHLRKKIIATIVMGLGVFSFFTTLYKTAAVVPGYLVAPGDVTGEVGQLMLWTLIEGNTVIIAGSIPTWGWLIKTDALERLITWISLHSLRTSRNQEVRLGSRDAGVVGGKVLADGHNQVETVADRRAAAPGPAGLDSIQQLERSANR